MLKLYNNHRGDTLVEVMIAVAVLAAIIGGGYSIATRSLNGIRLAQERSEATKIAEGQIELYQTKVRSLRTDAELLAFIGDSPVEEDPATGSSRFKKNLCFNNSGAIVDIDDLNNYPTDCQTGYYNVLVESEIFQNGVTSSTYAKGTATISWERSSGSGTEKLTLAYRSYLLPGVTP